jgi:hypothetical protein
MASIITGSVIQPLAEDSDGLQGAHAEGEIIPNPGYPLPLCDPDVKENELTTNE